MGMVPTSLIPWAAEGASPRRFPPQVPVSFCFLTTARAVLDSDTARWAASRASGVAYPAGASSVSVRYRIEAPAFSSSQVSGIRCWLGSSRSAPGEVGAETAAKIEGRGRRR